MIAAVQGEAGADTLGLQLAQPATLHPRRTRLQALQVGQRMTAFVLSQVRLLCEAVGIALDSPGSLERLLERLLPQQETHRNLEGMRGMAAQQVGHGCMCRHWRAVKCCRAWAAARSPSHQASCAYVAPQVAACMACRGAPRHRWPSSRLTWTWRGSTWQTCAAAAASAHRCSWTRRR